MEQDDFPPPPPEVLSEDEDGQLFEFDDDLDDGEALDAQALPPFPPDPDYTSSSQKEGIPTSSPAAVVSSESNLNTVCLKKTEEADLHAPSQDSSAPGTSLFVAAISQYDFPPPPEEGTIPEGLTSGGPNQELPPPAEGAGLHGGAASQPKVSPYSVIDITTESLPPPSSPPPNMTAEEVQDVPSSPGVPSGYSVPVPCGYATPSNVPIITPTYTTPVIIRHFSADEDVTVVGAGHALTDSVFTEMNPSIREEDALAKWASDPANTAWMENPDEVIYDDVPRENSGSTTDVDEMIYDDVELGEEGGSSSVENGWSSSEFESYDEGSDGESGHGENGLLPNAFIRRHTPSSKTHLSQDLTRLKEHYERKVKDLMVNAVGTVELQQLKHKHEQKMQKLVRAAKHGTKDGLEKTKAAVKKGKYFIRTKSFGHERKSACFEEESSDLFIEVECLNVEPVLSPAPEGLSEQQVVRRCILESILESEKKYLESLKRILEQYEKPLAEMEPRLLSERKCKVVFHRVREILQCHAMFQIALASRVAEWDELQSIGDVFVASFSKSMVLDAYSDFVNNFSMAMAVVRKTCAAKPSFLDFLKQRQESSRDRVTLYGLMMKPIQRFPQFILLLQDMLKNTPVGHADRLPLQMALTELETLAEKLSERKREADQRCEIRHIAKAMNERYLNKLLSGGSRYLIRSDDVVETVYNERGEIIKTKERRLFLLNDVLMCATPNLRSPQDGGSAQVSSGQRFLLKWSVPLSLVETVEFGSSDDVGDPAPFPTPHSGEKMVINAKPNKLYVGPGQLYQDLQNLLHDLNLVKQISIMICSLKGNYQNVNAIVAQDWISGLQRLILKKEEEIRAADRCRIQLQLPGKQDKTGRPTFFTAVFNTMSPRIKQTWISNLQMAKLTLEEHNLQGWFIAEDDGNQIKRQKHPLLLKHLPVIMSRLQEFKVECAVHNPEPLMNCESTADVPAVGHGCVWVASCTNQMAQIAIVALHNSSPKVTECFNVESRILCMTYVPVDEPLEGAEGNPEARSCSTPRVCVGTEEGSISVYKSSQRSKKVRLQQFFSPEKAAVTCLAYKRPFLYAGLVSGSLAVFSRTSDGFWDSSSVRVLKLGVLPVKAVLAVGASVWASSGGHVFIVDAQSNTVEHQLEAHHEEGMVVSQMVVAGVGIWIAFSSGSTLRLFHTETLEHLQDINIATPVHNLLSGHQRVSVSSLLVCHGLFLVGTNVGVTVALSVPRLQGIPKVTGRGMVSFHAHHGPVKFLTMAPPVQNAMPTGADACGQRVDPPEDDDASEAASLPPAETEPTVPIHQDSLSSSRSSLEHGPEDGAIYDLLTDPARSQNAKRARRVDVSSFMVLSGGAGHRRVNRKSKATRHEESIPTVMVWQIPALGV